MKAPVEPEIMAFHQLYALLFKSLVSVRFIIIIIIIINFSYTHQGSIYFIYKFYIRHTFIKFIFTFSWRIEISREQHLY